MIGKRLKELRKIIGLTQTELGKELGVTLGSIQNWEAETRSMPLTAIKLMEIQFNINPEWLKTGNGNMFREGFNGQYAIGHNIIQSNGDNNTINDGSIEITDEIKELLYLIENYATPKLIKDFKEKLMKIKEIQDSE